MDWRVGFDKAWQHTNFFFNRVLKVFKTTSIDKTLSYKIIDLAKRNKFCRGYFLRKGVVINKKRSELKRGSVFYIRSLTPEY